MTHDRGGAAVLGLIALAALLADTIYVSLRWDSATSRFGGGFLIGLAAIAFTFPLAKLLGAGEAIGSDRQRARRKAWRLQAAFLVQIAVVVVGGGLLLGDRGMVAVILGEVACATGAFVAAIAHAIARPKHHPQHSSLT
jgi:hypothetical protein